VKRVVWLALLVAVIVAMRGDAEACGGPDYGDFGALEPVETTLDEIASPDSYWAAWGQSEREELRFLYPFWREHPAKIQSLWAFSYDDGQPRPQAPSLSAFEQAVAAGDWTAADRAAHAVVDAWLDMPPVPAAEHRDALERAVEYLELRPAMASVPPDETRAFFLGEPLPPPGELDPVLATALEARRGGAVSAGARRLRAPSLELRERMDDFRRRVPNGYGDGVTQQVPASTFRDFERGMDDWIARHPKHPLVDSARLWKVRIHYFAGDFEMAWSELIALLPRRPVRALAEMRYLLLQDRAPSDALLDSLKDPVLITALAGERTLTPARAERWWKLVPQNLPHPWAKNLEERLLLWAARHMTAGALPAWYPLRRRASTPLGSKLRAAGLLRAGHDREAAAELRALPTDPEQATLLAKAELSMGQTERAARTAELDDDSRSYAVRVLASDAELTRLGRVKSKALRETATLELAARRAHAGDWRAATQIVKKGAPERLAAWTAARDLAARRGGDEDLARARFFAAHTGELFESDDPGFYRGLSSRYHPGTTDGAAIERALGRSTERWLALEAYARWLDTHSNHPDARAVLHEADAVYNLLVNWGGDGTFFWGVYAKQTETAATLRRVGAEIRARAP
jgi:hypothetical protein